MSSLPPVKGDVAYIQGAHTLAPPSAADGLLFASEQFLAGVNALPEPETEYAAVFLAGFSLECALKAFLSRSGMPDEALRDQERRHNLMKLWEEAAKAGLFTDSPPLWCKTLDELHAQEVPNKKGASYFHLRYPVAHGHVRPERGPMVQGLNEVVTTVQKKMRQ